MLGRYAGPKVTVEHQLRTPMDTDGKIDEQVQAAIEKIKAKAVSEMVAQMKSVGLNIDNANIQAAVSQYEKNPSVKEGAIEAVREVTAGLRGKTPDEIVETLVNDAQAVFAAAEKNTEIPLKNVLIPLLIFQGELDQKQLDDAARKELRGVKLSTKHLTTGGAGAAKRAIGGMAIPSAVLLHTTLAVVDTAVIEKAASGILSDWAVEGLTKDALAWGFSAAGNVLLVKQKLGVRGEWLRGTADFFWSETNRGRLYGALAASFLAIATPAILGNVKRGTVDTAVSGEVGQKMKDKYKLEVDRIRETIKLAQGLFGSIQPSIDGKMRTAFKEGGVGWGRRTWSINRVLYGKNEESDLNYENFKANPNSPVTFRGKPMAEFAGGTTSGAAESQQTAATNELTAAQKELEAVKKIPRGKTKAERAKYTAAVEAAELKVHNAKKAPEAAPGRADAETKTAAGAGPDPEAVEKAMVLLNQRYGINGTAGAEQYLKKLTDELEQVNPEQVFHMLDSLLKESEVLSKSGIIGNIFGVLAPVPSIFGTIGSNVIHGEGLGSFTNNVPWDEMLHSSSGVRAMFKTEEKYLAQRNEMVKELKKIMVSVQFEKYLSDVAKETGVDTQMPIPATTFQISDNLNGIDRTPYKAIIDKTVMDYVLPLMPPNDSPEWGYIDTSLRNSGITWIDVKTDAGKYQAMGLLVGFVLTILAGSVWYTIAMKKLSKRWGIKGALRDDEKRGLFATESKIVTDMVKLVRDRENTVMGAIVKSGGNPLPQRDEVALSAVLQRRLREQVLSMMDPPLDTTPQGIAFINRENSLPSRKLRNAYATKLNEYIEGYKNDRSGAVATILDDIDEGRYEEIEALQAFVKQTESLTTTDRAKQSVAAWWERIDAKFVNEEITARKADIQNLYAEREVVVNLRTPLRIPLTDSVAADSISPADIVYTSRLSELDGLIATHHEAIKQITKGAVDGPIQRDTNVVFSQQQTQELRDELQNEELNNNLDGTDITSVAKEYSALAQSLGKRVRSLESFVTAAFGEQTAGGRIAFEYAYRPDIGGPTIVINLQRADGEILAVPLQQSVPNRLLATDEAIIQAAAQWLRPDSKEMRLMRLYSVHDSYKTAADAIKKEVLGNAASGLVDLASFDEAKFANLQDLLKRTDVIRVQKQLLEQTKASVDPLNQVQQRVFEEPDKVSLGGMWKKDIRAVFKAATDYYEGSNLHYDVGTEEIVVRDASGERRVNVRNVPNT